MFIDQEGKEEIQNLPQEEDRFAFFRSRKNLIILGVSILAIIIAVAVFWFLTREPVAPVPEGPLEEEPIATLPEEERTEEQLLDDIFDTDIQAELITFGDYYQEATDDNIAPKEDYSLPINVKTDTSNYYDVSRVINLDSAIDDLNENGFAILENPFYDNANFFSVNNHLKEKKVPTVLTSDFLLYYYQNVLKDVYKDVEANVFYENLWAINKKLFDIANARYRNRMKEEDSVNDFLLEAERLEAAFFAVGLELLEPKDNEDLQQIGLTEGLGFTLKEAKEFSFELPEYLTEDVNKELELIRQAEGMVKSPVTRYLKTYDDFNIPKEYQKSARLTNFYLASKWLNSVWPLYNQDEGCDSCLLDEDDNRINFLAALLIANDFSHNQDIKNQWAIVYKILAFFSGLRRDLNYLHYHQALADNFGEDYDVEEIFNDESRVNSNLAILKNNLSKHSFFDIEGGFSRDDNQKGMVGMRVLSDFFWPSTYILGQFTDPHVGSWNGSEEYDRDLNITACVRSDLRCRAIGLDVVNLVYEIPPSYDYFVENSQYDNYNQQVTSLRSQLAGFNKDSWRNNNFWSTLDMMKALLNTDESTDPVYFQNPEWKEKQVNTALGAILNLQLGADELALSGDDKRLGATDVCNQDNYAEPDLDLVNELAANSRMLFETLSALGVAAKVNTIPATLAELTNRLEGFKEIAVKELEGEELSMEDCRLLDVLANQYQVKESSEKYKEFSFGEGRSREMIERISGIKLLALVYEKDGEKLIAIGPIFNFMEYEP